MIRHLNRNPWEREYRRFAKAMANPERVQLKLLKRILKANRNTQFGRQYNFKGIRSIEDFQQSVPLQPYEQYLPYIRRICQGEQDVLTADPVEEFHLTFGTTSTTGTPKLIPITASLREDYMKSLRAWLWQIASNHPRTQEGSIFVDPAIARDLPSLAQRSTVSVEIPNISSHFSSHDFQILNSLRSVPEIVDNITANEPRQYITALFLLAAEDLTWISISSPLLLIETLSLATKWWPALIRDMADGTISPPGEVDMSILEHLQEIFDANRCRATQLDQLHDSFESGQESDFWQSVWPDLSLITLPTDGWAANSFQAVQKIFPAIPLQAGGFCATEAIISVPYQLNGIELQALALRSHFFEFRSRRHGGFSLAHELIPGEEYEVIVTTSGGLYRYPLGDLIRVVDTRKGAPLIRFVAKTDYMSDLCGEKLEAAHVEQVLRGLLESRALATTHCFLAPEKDGSKLSYVLFLPDYLRRQAGPELARQLDVMLSQNAHYRQCRHLGHLGSARIFYYNLENRGKYLRTSSGDICAAHFKPQLLESRAGWLQVLTGVFGGQESRKMKSSPTASKLKPEKIVISQKTADENEASWLTKARSVLGRQGKWKLPDA